MKLGKRQRRALVRLRHALATKKFLRWLNNPLNTLPARSWLREAILCSAYAPHRHALWHRWHASGCP